MGAGRWYFGTFLVYTSGLLVHAATLRRAHGECDSDLFRTIVEMLDENTLVVTLGHACDGLWTH